MWFKNISLFRLAKNWNVTAGQLADMLASQQFTPSGASAESSEGWTHPRPDGALVYAVNGQWLLQFKTEKKLLPSSVVDTVTKERAAELEEQQGFAPGRKAMKDLKERVRDELLPRAFSTWTTTNVWIDPVNGWLAIDTSSSNKADEIIKFLLKCCSAPLQSATPKLSPITCMTDWLAGDEAPRGFTIDQDAELSTLSEDKATVKFVRHTLDAADIQRHIATGKQCKKLALTWNDKISFVLDSYMTIRRIRPLDILQESKAENDVDRFDADFVLMTAELDKLLDALIDVLGGENDAQTDLVQDDASAPTPENEELLYQKALELVKISKRPTISSIQRHLRIGYNQAARMLDRMEKGFFVSPLQPDGTRFVLEAVNADL